MFYSEYNIITKLPDEDPNYEALIFNRLSGNASILNKEEYEILEKFESKRDFKKVPNNLLEKLKEDGYLFASKDVEDKLYGKLKKEHSLRQDKGPIQFHIVATHGCNLACTYCFESGVAGKKIEFITDDMLEKLKSYILDFVNSRRISHKDVNISLFGGEPLLDIERNHAILENVCKFAQENNFSIAITTNAYHLERFFPLLDKYKSSLKGIQITIDGPKEFHDKQRILHNGAGTFDKISENIDEGLKRGYPINLRMNLNLETVKHLDSLFDYYENRGWLAYDNLFMNYGRIMEFYQPDTNEADADYKVKMRYALGEAFAKIEKKKPEYEKYLSYGLMGLDHLYKHGNLPLPTFNHCFGTVNVLALDLKGNVYPCSPGIGREEWVVDRFDDAQAQTPLTIADFRSRNIDKIEKCSSCSGKSVCGGGCPIVAKSRNGCMNTSDCLDYMSEFEAGLHYVWPKIKRELMQKEL